MRGPHPADQLVLTHRCPGEASSRQPPGRTAIARAVRCALAACLLSCVACGSQQPSRSAGPSSAASPSSANRALTAEDSRAVGSLRKAVRRSGSFFADKDRCFATGLVRELGVKKLTAVGLLNKDLTVPQDAFVRAGSMSTRD